MANRFHPFVINLELLLRLNIVVDHHLFAADDCNAAGLARIQPTHTNMGHHVIGETHGHIGDIFDPLLHTGRALGRNPDRHLPKQMQQDRDIMRS